MKDPQTHVPIEGDLLLRWLAEAFLATGHAREHSLLLAQTVTRLVLLKDADAVLMRIMDDLDAFSSARLSCESGYELTRLTPSTARIHDVKGHPVLALHAGMELAVHTAAHHGWAAFEISMRSWEDALLAYLHQVAGENVCCMAVANPAGDAPVTLYSAAPPSTGGLDASVVEIAFAAFAPNKQDCSLSCVLHDLGVSLRLPRSCTGELQCVVIDSELLPADWNAARLAHQRVSAAAGSIHYSLASRTRTLQVRQDVERRMLSFTVRLKIVDPTSRASFRIQ